MEVKKITFDLNRDKAIITVDDHELFSIVRLDDGPVHASTTLGQGEDEPEPKPKPRLTPDDLKAFHPSKEEWDSLLNQVNDAIKCVSDIRSDFGNITILGLVHDVDESKRAVKFLTGRLEALEEEPEPKPQPIGKDRNGTDVYSEDMLMLMKEHYIGPTNKAYAKCFDGAHFHVETDDARGLWLPSDVILCETGKNNPNYKGEQE